MRKYNPSMLCRITVVFLATLLVFGMAITVYADGSNANISLDGLASVAGANLKVGYSWQCGYKGAGNVVATDNTIVCTANGRNGIGTDYATTLTVTLTNDNTIEKTLKFNLTVNTSDGSVTLAGNSVQNTSYEFPLAAGASVQLVILTGKTNTENKVTLSNVTLTSDAITKVKYVAPVDQAGNVLGSYKLNGADVVGTTAEYSTESTISAFAVSPKSGYKHVGWKTESGANIGNPSNLTAIPKPDMTEDANGDGFVEVYPFLVPTSAATYRVDNKDYYYWQEAMTAAAASSSKLVTVVANGTLPGGTANNWVADTSDGNTANDYAVANSDGTVTYYVPSGIRFLVPYSAGDDGTFVSGESYTDKATTDPAVYRTLTVAPGAHIICNGEMNVSGQRHEYTQPHSGRAAGGHGLIKLQGSGTQLTINGKLYCYGFIAGSGQVVVNGTMHELLQMAAWNGGSFSTNWAGKADNSTVLFLSSYHVQNVEAPLRVNAGASVYAETVITGTIPVVNREVSVRKSCAFIMPYSASEGLFLLDTGTYITRTYDPSTDRVAYTIGKDSGNGNVKFGSIVIKAGIPVIGEITIDSKSYVLPVTSVMDIVFDSGVVLSFANKVTVLPGGKVTIADGATVNLSNTMYLFDQADWTATMSYPTDKTSVPQYYTVGRGKTAAPEVTKSACLEINGDMNIASGGGIYTTNGLFTTDADGNEVLGAASADVGKIIYGTGTITHTTAQSNPYVISTNTSGVTLKAGYDSTLHRINLTHGAGRLAGITVPDTEGNLRYDTFPFAAGSKFFGLGEDYDHYWYQHVVMVEGGLEGVIPYGSSVGEKTGYKSGVRSVNTATADTTASNVVGYAVNGGTFSFTVDPMKVCSVSGIDPDENGIYTISGITADMTITVVEHTELTDAAVAPTCTETGLTEGKHCGVCNAVLVSQEVVSALSHDHQLIETVEATCTEDGHMTYDCSRCDDSYTETLAATGHTPDEMVNVCYDDQHCTVCNELMKPAGHTYPESGGPCTVCGLFEIYASSLRAGDSLKLYFYVQSARMPDLNVDASEYNYRAEIIRSKEGVKQDPEYIPASQWTDFGGGLYRFSYDGIAAKEMTDDLVVTIYKKNGDSWVAITNSKTESVAGYAVRYLTKGFSGEIVAGSKDAVLRTALVDMLNYGAACQAEFGYNTGNLANKDITAYQGYKTSDVTPSYLDNKFSYFAGSTVTVKNSLVYTFYAKESALGKTARITYTNHYGVTHTWTTTITNTTTTTSNGNTYYGVRVTDLAIADGRQKITCELLDGDTVIETVYGSVEDYVYSQLLGTNQTSDVELRNAVQCLMNFIDSAYKYFHFDDTTT